MSRRDVSCLPLLDCEQARSLRFLPVDVAVTEPDFSVSVSGRTELFGLCGRE